MPLRCGLAVLAIALAAIPSGQAKLLAKLVVVGGEGRAVELPVSLFESLPTDRPAHLRGGFLLVYPLMDDGLPARPARIYPEAGAVCGSWNTSTEPVLGRCLRLTAPAGRRFADLDLVRFRKAPPRLVRLVGPARALKSGNHLLGLELAFNRWREARRAARPVRCVRVRAQWEPPGRRPSAFCLARDGAWAAGRLYAYGRGVCRAADLVGSIFEPALPDCV